jgi:hypothetical protein
MSLTTGRKRRRLNINPTRCGSSDVLMRKTDSALGIASKHTRASRQDGIKWTISKRMSAFELSAPKTPAASTQARQQSVGNHGRHTSTSQRAAQLRPRQWRCCRFWYLP